MRHRVVLVDLDGVVWRGGRVIRENVAWLRKAREAGATLIYTTNNSTRTRRYYAEKLSRIMGYQVSVEEVYTSGYTAALLLRRLHGVVTAAVLGEEGLVEELAGQGHLVYPLLDAARARPRFLVVGLDRNLTYARLKAAHRLLAAGSELVATNTDHTIPLEEGDAPGAGAIVAALTASTGRKPVLVAGKPEPHMYLLALERLGVEASEALAVGDRCDTDIEAARRAGIESVLVLTGVAGERGQRCAADHVAENLSALTI